MRLKLDFNRKCSSFKSFKYWDTQNKGVSEVGFTCFDFLHGSSAFEIVHALKLNFGFSFKLPHLFEYCCMIFSTLKVGPPPFQHLIQLLNSVLLLTVDTEVNKVFK